MHKTKTAAIRFLSFFLPASVVLAAFAGMGIAPFGDKSTLIMDLSNQYVEFLNGLKYGDIFFSWSKSLGTNYIGLFSYYVSSPFSILTLFFPNSMMPVAILFLTVLKIGLCGLTFGILLQSKFGQERYSIALFSLFYGLMSYNIAYSMCIMWLDAVIWLPIIILGIERILEGKSGKGFITALFLSFLSNYYLSYMVVLFVSLYFVYRCLEEALPKAKFLICLRRFILGGITAAALSAFLLLPTLASLFEGKIGDHGVDYSTAFNFTLPDFFGKLLPFRYDSITNAGAPFLYSGTIPLLLFLGFFCLKKIRLRSKLLTGAFTLILFFSLWISALDKIWHVFQFPNWFPYRYAFVLSFLMILTAYRAFLLINWNIRSVFLGLTIFALCSAEMYGNTFAILKGLDQEFGYESDSAYRGYRKDVSDLLSATPGRKDSGRDFYRVGATLERSKNEPIGFGYNGITHYSSTYHRNVNHFLARLGFAQAHIWSSYFGSTMLTDALFSVRYVLSDHPVSPYYSRVTENDLAALYYNPYTISIGTVVDCQSLSGFDFVDNPFKLQNNLIQALTGTSGTSGFEKDNNDTDSTDLDGTATTGIDPDGKCFTEIETASSSGSTAVEYRFLSEGKPVYAFFTGGAYGDKLSVNGNYVSPLFTNETRCIQYIGTFEAGTPVSVMVDTLNAAAVESSFYQLDTNTLRTAVETMKSSGFLPDHYDRQSISGTVTAGNGDVLFTTIPYDAGWNVYLDGKQVQKEVFADTFLVIPLTAGTHTVKMVYTAPGLIPGIVVSLISLIIVIIKAITGQKK